jgi:D-sedoheptulose 7-phosphate isomerase
MSTKITQDRLEDFCQKCNSPIEYLRGYERYLSQLLAGLDFNAVGEVIKVFNQARERAATIFFIGNGGSAATASHFAQDLGEVGRKTGGPCFRTLSLTDNVSFITAMGNDYGYETIFICQMNNLFRKGDVLVAISASGNSPNVVQGVKLARELGGITIGLVGFDGGELLKLCDYVIHVEANKGEYGPVEDIHLVLDHMITSYLTWR